MLRIPRTRLGSGVFSGFSQIVRDPQWRLFLLITLVTGTGSTFINHFLFIYYDAIGGTGTLRGIALTIATVSEVTILFTADRLMRRFRPGTLMLVALAAVGIRMTLYGVISNPVVALLPQLLHGLSFGLLLVSGVALARRLAPEGMRATAQAVFAATHMGAGGIASAILGGVLYRYFPVPALFFVGGLILIAAVIVFATAGSAGRSLTTKPQEGE
jgi:MFS family permease